MRTLFIIALVTYGLWRYANGDFADAFKAAEPTPVISNSNPQGLITISHTAPTSSAHTAALPYRCDGRQHCSQMGSYQEAVFFLRNCPNTKMDGDGDGIPCKRQFGR